VLSRIVDLKTNERAPALWSFVYFFCLLSSYTMLRPLREEMGIQGGVENLQWVFTGTFVAMLVCVPIFGWAAARYARRVLLPGVYLFFILNLAVFYALFTLEIAPVHTARAFFIWVSVFNLFVVSVFWSFMADLFTNEQARRLFGFIAAGGSAGAFAGPALTALLAVPLGAINLLPLSATLLAATLVCISRLGAWGRDRRGDERALGGGMLEGVRVLLRSPYLLGICAYIVLYSTLSTFLYFEQAHIVKAAIADSDERTRLFAIIDATVNVLALGIQVFVTGRLIARFGLAFALGVAPAVAATGFGGLAAFASLPVLLVFQVLHRAANHAVAKPAREILFTVISREQKYKSKNFIDTVVYRGGDAASGWLFTGLTTLGFGLAAVSQIAVPVALIWLFSGVALGRRQERLRSEPISARAVSAEHG
jgi:ATP:ADP antiporter, AAA family